jgi:hypothetical protein
MKRMLLLCSFIAPICAATLPSDVPSWVLRGILSVESQSYYRTDGSIAWIDRKRGAAGERGCFQITKAAFTDVRRPGETFSMLESDPIFSEVIACRYLAKIHRGSWGRTVEAYNAGPGKRSPTYRRLVERAGKDK